MRVISEIMKFQTSRRLDKQNYDWINETMSIFEELLEARGYDVPKSQRESFLKPLAQHLRSKAATNAAITWSEPTVEDKVDAHADQIVFNVGAIMKLGYDPEIVLYEVAKEINSRKGDMINGKFEKHTTPQAKALWYKADFSSAKLL